MNEAVISATSTSTSISRRRWITSARDGGDARAAPAPALLDDGEEARELDEQDER